MVMCNGLDRNGKEAILTCSETLSQNSHGETEKPDDNSEKICSGRDSNRVHSEY
jgi:hypothetical protein